MAVIHRPSAHPEHTPMGGEHRLRLARARPLGGRVSRCSGEPRWPPGGRPASPAPGHHGTGGGAPLYGRGRDTYGRDPGRGRGFSRPPWPFCPPLKNVHLRGVESRRKGAAKAPRLPAFNAALRPCRTASVRPRPPDVGTRVRGARSEPVHVRPGPRRARLGHPPPPRRYRRHIEAGASAHQRGLLTARGAAGPSSTPPLGNSATF